MHPTVFGVSSYGIMIALCGVSFVLIGNRLAKRNGLPPDTALDIVLIAFFVGVLGARVLFVVENWSTYFALQPWTEVLRIDKGGLSFYGGVLLASPFYFLLAWRRGIRLLPAADMFCYGIPLAQAFGRLGCFLWGCCWGDRADDGVLGAIAVRFPAGTPAWVSHVQEHLGTDELSPAVIQAAVHDLPPALQSASWPVVPVQLFMSVAGFLMVGAALAFHGRHRRDGEVLALVFALMGVSRFLLDLLRADNPPLALGMTESQWLSIAWVVIAAALFAGVRRWGRDFTPGDLAVDPSPETPDEPAA